MYIYLKLALILFKAFRSISNSPFKIFDAALATRKQELEAASYFHLYETYQKEKFHI